MTHSARRALATRLTLAIALLCAYATASPAFPALAIEEDPFAIPPAPEELAHVYDGSRHAPSLEMSERIRERLGGDWRVVTWNPLSGCARRVWGSGIDVAPAILTATDAELAAREFVRANPDFFGGATPRNLARYRVTHAMGKWAVLLQQTVRGIPVEGALVTITLTDSGRLYAFGANVYGEIAFPPAAMPREAAVAIARDALPYDAATPMTRAADETVILPVFDPDGEGRMTFRLTHVTEVATAEPYGLYRTWVDAGTGEIVRRENQVSHAYSGRVTGDIETSGYCAGNAPGTPLANMNVVIETIGTAVTDSAGNFTIGGNSDPFPFTARFDGPIVNVNCIGCAGGDAVLSGTIEPGLFEEVVFDSASYRADERDVFWVVNRSYAYIRSLDSTWTYPKVTANVNVNSSCNANWGGTVLNFFREGGGCHNTGEIADIVAHEYGHCVQASLMGGAQGPNGQGEGNADIAATFFDDGSLIGVGVVNCADGLSCPGNACRDCENSLQWPADAVGRPIHAAGRVICGFNWDARQGLEAKYGPAQGKLATARLWHFSRKMYGYSGYDQDDEALDYFVVNDDNGNLLDGTPDYAELRAAAVNHAFPYPPVITIVHTPIENTTDVTNPYAVVATITAPGSILDADSLLVHYRVDGAGPYATATMTPTGNPDEYSGSIPPQSCGSLVEYYITADDTGGVRETSPTSAPDEAHGFHVAATLYIQNFEDASDWTTDASNTAFTGAFVRIDPVGTNWQPGVDASPAPGVSAWITAQNPGGADGTDDVDFGVASTVSPIIDLTGWDDVTLSFKYFHGQRDDADDPGADFFRVQISNDGGATYPVDLVSIGDVVTAPLWTPVWVDVAAAIPLTNQMRLRVQASDELPGGDVIEAGIDDIVITACAPPPPDTTAPLVELLSPNGGEALVIGTSAPITWSASDSGRGVAGIDILLSRDGGAAYDTTIAANEPNDGSFTWDLTNAAPTNLARIKIVAADSAMNVAEDASAANFTIGPPPSAPPTIVVSAPNGGEMLDSSSVFPITWVATDDIGVIGIEIRLSTNGGVDFDTLVAAGLPDSGVYDWAVTNVTTSEALIRVTAIDANYQTASDTSDTTFTILFVPPDTVAPSVAVLSPNGGEALVIDSLATITWTATDSAGVTSIDILLSRDGGAAYDTTLAEDEPNDGSFTWNLTGASPTNLARVKIVASDAALNLGEDASDANFTIGPPPSSPPTVLVGAPNGGEMLQGRSVFPITWVAGDDIGIAGVDIRLSTNAGADFGTIIAQGVTDTGSFDWSVTNVTTAEALIEIVVIDANYQTAADTSDTTFTIAFTPTGVEIVGSAPERAFLAASIPEPFTEITTVRFGVTRPGSVVLAVYSVEGRLVRELASGARAPGAYETTWDGRDGRGAPVTSGRYFIRLTTPESALTRSATFLR